MIDPVAFTIGGIDVQWYGILIVTGMALGCLTGMLREQRLGLPRDTAVDLTLLGVPCAIVGARVYYVAFAWQSYAQGPFWRVFAVWEGGLAIYGGLIAALISGYAYARVKKLSFLRLADLAAPGFAIGQCVGRWGNFVNREAYGVAVSNAALQFFPVCVDIEGTWYAATFFYESAWCLIVFIFLLMAERRRFFRRAGDTFLWYAFLYALERACVEGLRTDSLYLGTLRVSQLLSLCAAAAVLVIWGLRGGRRAAWRAVWALAAVALAAALMHAGMLAAGLGALIAALALGVWAYTAEDVSA